MHKFFFNSKRKATKTAALKTACKNYFLTGAALNTTQIKEKEPYAASIITAVKKVLERKE